MSARGRAYLERAADQSSKPAQTEPVQAKPNQANPPRQNHPGKPAQTRRTCKSTGVPCIPTPPPLPRPWPRPVPAAKSGSSPNPPGPPRRRPRPLWAATSRRSQTAWCSWPTGEPLLILTSGGHRVDTRYVAESLGVGALRRANPDQVRAATGSPSAASHPSATHPPCAPWWTPRCRPYPVVWAAGGTPHAVFPTSYAGTAADLFGGTGHGDRQRKGDPDDSAPAG